MAADPVVEHDDVPIGREVGVVLAEERAGHGPLDLVGLAVDHQQRLQIAQRHQQVAGLEHAEMHPPCPGAASRRR